MIQLAIITAVKWEKHKIADYTFSNSLDRQSRKLWFYARHSSSNCLTYGQNGGSSQETSPERRIVIGVHT